PSHGVYSVVCHCICVFYLSLSHLLCYHILFFLHFFFFFFNDTAPTEIYTLSLHDALPIPDIFRVASQTPWLLTRIVVHQPRCPRSEEHTSELQSRVDLVCRLLLEKKNNGAGEQYACSTDKTCVEYQKSR